MSDEAMKQDTSRIIQERLEASGRNMMDLATAVNVSFTAAHNWAHGKNLPSRKRIPAIAEFLGIPEQELRDAVFGGVTKLQPSNDGNAVKSREVDSHESIRPAAISDFGPRNIPVLGVVVGGAKSDFHLNGETVSYVRRPAAISELSEVYALYVVGTSMAPRFKDGELIYVHKRTPAIGDDVVIQLKPLDGGSPNRGFVKHLIRRNGTHIICGQYNPEGEVRYENSEIVSIHRVLPWNELLGV